MPQPPPGEIPVEEPMAEETKQDTIDPEENADSDLKPKVEDFREFISTELSQSDIEEDRRVKLEELDQLDDDHSIVNRWLAIS